MKQIDKIKSQCTVVAIDPDMRKPGVAFVGAQGEVLHIKSMPMSLIVQLLHDPVLAAKVWAVEDVNKNGAIYHQKKTDSQGKRNRRARNVGMVQSAGVIISDLITDITGNQPIMAPVGIGKQVKNNAKLFKELTGWPGTSNEDTRDAAAIGIWVAYELNKKTKI